jgi:uncharacterized membrane protein
MRRAGRPCRRLILIIFGAMPVMLMAGITLQVQAAQADRWYVVALLLPIALAEEAEHQRSNGRN